MGGNFRFLRQGFSNLTANELRITLYLLKHENFEMSRKPVELSIEKKSLDADFNLFYRPNCLSLESRRFRPAPTCLS
jgi:hypothetical protein